MKWNVLQALAYAGAACVLVTFGYLAFTVDGSAAGLTAIGGVGVAALIVLTALMAKSPET